MNAVYVAALEPVSIDNVFSLGTRYVCIGIHVIMRIILPDALQIHSYFCIEWEVPQGASLYRVSSGEAKLNPVIE